MKYTHKILSALAALLAAAALAGCSRDPEVIDPNTGASGNEVILTVDVPGMRVPTESRGLTDIKNKITAYSNKIAGVYVLLFSVDDSDPANVDERFVIGVEASSIADVSANGDIKYSFRAQLPAQNNVRLVLIVNGGGGLMTNYGSVLAGLAAGDTKQSVLAQFTHSYSPVMEDISNYGAVMYGETGKIDIAPGGKYSNIQLIRSTALCEVTNTATNFTMSNSTWGGTNEFGDVRGYMGVTIGNSPSLSYVAPVWRPHDGQIISPAPQTPVMPAGYLPLITAYHVGYDQFQYSSFFMLESLAANDAVEAERKDAQCLIFFGRYAGDNKDYFYRADFTYDGTNGVKGEYMSILRNHKYIVTITGCDGPGYKSYDAALASYTTQSNLHVKILSYDEGKIKDVTFNGQYMLGVSDAAPKVSKDLQDFSLDVFTDYPAVAHNSPSGTYSWKAEIQAHTGSWLKFQNNSTIMTGTSNDKLLLLKSVFANPGPTDRTATIELSAGRLRKTVVVTQSKTSNLILRVIDSEGNDIDRLICFVEGGSGVNAETQKFYISCSPANMILNVSNTPGSPAFLGIVTAPGGSVPGITTYNVVAQSGTKTDPVRTVTYTFTATDASGNQITKQLLIKTVNLYNLPVVPADYTRLTVGAFWKSNQVGERFPFMGKGTNKQIPASDWMATVYRGADWIKLSSKPSSDPGITFNPDTENPADMNGAGDNLYQVEGNARTIRGNLPVSIAGFRFRIGLKSTYTPTALAPARYGLVIVSTENDTYFHKIYIRQGEAPDYLMKPGDPDGNGMPVADNRAYAKRFSPYNLTAATLTYGTTVASHTQLAVNGGTFTKYPSLTGALFQFSSTTHARRAYHPCLPATGDISGWDASPPSDNWDAIKATQETCPKNYSVSGIGTFNFRRPSDGSTSAINSTGAVAGSEIRQSLWLNPQAGTGSNLDNVLRGLYADGFYDRRITAKNSNGTTDETKTDVADWGVLFFNPADYRSLFFPASANRINTGQPQNLGVGGSYWTSSTSTSSNAWRTVFHYPPFTLVSMVDMSRNNALPIRCVVDE